MCWPSVVGGRRGKSYVRPTEKRDVVVGYSGALADLRRQRAQTVAVAGPRGDAGVEVQTERERCRVLGVAETRDKSKRKRSPKPGLPVPESTPGDPE